MYVYQRFSTNRKRGREAEGVQIFPEDVHNSRKGQTGYSEGEDGRSRSDDCPWREKECREEKYQRDSD